MEKVIGAGAYGKVWRGSYAGSPVAVKETLAQGSEEDIEKEVILLGKIRNPNCVRLLGIFRKSDDPKLYIVTEYVDSGDLTHILRDNAGRLSELVKLKIMRDVARGMTFLHENNIVHRDLKTDNCLIYSIQEDAHQYAVVADFGISKIAPQMGRSDESLTVGMGTPVYMAPECFRKHYTTKVDVYSFGIVMNEVFSEERPWSHLDTMWNHEIHDRVDQGERPRMNIDPNRHPHEDEIRRIICACWAQSEEDRPKMKEVLIWLDKLILSCPRMPPAAHSQNSSYSTNAPGSQTYSPCTVPYRPDTASPYSSYSGCPPPFASSASSSDLPSYATLKGGSYSSQAPSGTQSPPYLQQQAYQSSSDIPRYATVTPSTVPSYLSGLAATQSPTPSSPVMDPNFYASNK